MKQIICGLFALALWLPYAASALTTEEQLQLILKDFVAILELRHSQLQQILVEQDPLPFKLATAQGLTGLAATSTSKKRGTGGSNNRPATNATTTPIVRPISLSSNINTFNIVSNETYVISRITLNTENFPTAVPLPDQLILRASVIPTDNFEIIFSYNPVTAQYESEDLADNLNTDENWQGTFTFLIPIDLISFNFAYEIELNIDGELYNETLINPGFPEVEIITNPISVSEISYTAAAGILDETLWSINFNNSALGNVYIDTIVIDSQNSTGETADELFSEIRLVSSNGQTFVGSYDEQKIVFADLAIEIVGESSFSLSLVGDFEPRNQDTSLLLALDNTDVEARNAYGEVYELPIGYTENDLITLVERSLRLQTDSFVGETQWLNPDETTGEFILSFILEANGQDYYVRSDASLLSDLSGTGVGYSINGDTDFISVTESVLIQSDEVSEGVYIIRSGDAVNVSLALEVTTSEETELSVFLNELWYSSNADGSSDAEVIEFTPANQFETAPLIIKAPL